MAPRRDVRVEADPELSDAFGESPAKLAKSDNAEIRSQATILAVIFGDAHASDEMRKIVVSSSGAAHKPSMLQDYEHGRPMEVEAQLMAPLALARAAKVHTPLLDVLVPLVAAKAAARGLYEH